MGTSDRKTSKNFTLFFVIIAILALVVPLIYFMFLAPPIVDIRNVFVTNVTSTSVTVTWVTNQPSTGTIFYSNNDNLASFFPYQLNTGIAMDDRDSASTPKGEFEAHHVTIKNLNPGTKYNFIIGNNAFTARRDLKQFEFTTADISKSVSTPNPIYGKVFYPNGRVATDGFVFLRLRDEKYQKDSALLSTFVNKDGSWSLDRANAMTFDNKDQFKLSENVTNVIEVDFVNKGVVEVQVKDTHAKPVSDLYLRDGTVKDLSSYYSNIESRGQTTYSSFITPASSDSCSNIGTRVDCDTAIGAEVEVTMFDCNGDGAVDHTEPGIILGQCEATVDDYGNFNDSDARNAERIEEESKSAGYATKEDYLKAKAKESHDNQANGNYDKAFSGGMCWGKSEGDIYEEVDSRGCTRKVEVLAGCGVKIEYTSTGESCVDPSTGETTVTRTAGAVQEADYDDLEALAATGKKCGETTLSITNPCLRCDATGENVVNVCLAGGVGGPGGLSVEPGIDASLAYGCEQFCASNPNSSYCKNAATLEICKENLYEIISNEFNNTYADEFLANGGQCISAECQNYFESNANPSEGNPSGGICQIIGYNATNTLEDLEACVGVADNKASPAFISGWCAIYGGDSTFNDPIKEAMCATFANYPGDNIVAEACADPANQADCQLAQASQQYLYNANAAACTNYYSEERCERCGCTTTACGYACSSELSDPRVVDPSDLNEETSKAPTLLESIVISFLKTVAQDTFAAEVAEKIYHMTDGKVEDFKNYKKKLLAQRKAEGKSTKVFEYLGFAQQGETGKVKTGTNRIIKFAGDFPMGSKIHIKLPDSVGLKFSKSNIKHDLKDVASLPLVLGGGDDNQSNLSSQVEAQSTSKEIEIDVSSGDKDLAVQFEDSKTGQPVVVSNVDLEVSSASGAEVTINLTTGWNLIALPLSSNVTAETLLQEIARQSGSATTVTTYENNAWKSFVLRGDTTYGSDFAIEPTKAYFVSVMKPSQVKISGENITTDLSALTFTKGWNLVPLSKNSSGEAVLDQLQTSGKKATTVSDYNSGQFFNLIKQDGVLYGKDFQIEDLKGYFVLVDE